ncbi:unnamed protein product [Pleuronectes platessa]|uniref:Uncharacterized protein n=1 Tax=Pleuronectes platessa TaxID=8262 RepID=A0A9N7Y356_PLEPL|nr:unnamed protein product [Pleuronectes platessa]
MIAGCWGFFTAQAVPHSLLLDSSRLRSVGPPRSFTPRPVCEESCVFIPPSFHPPSSVLLLPCLPPTPSGGAGGSLPWQLALSCAGYSRVGLALGSASQMLPWGKQKHLSSAQPVTEAGGSLPFCPLAFYALVPGWHIYAGSEKGCRLQQTPMESSLHQVIQRWS